MGGRSSCHAGANAGSGDKSGHAGANAAHVDESDRRAALLEGRRLFWATQITELLITGNQATIEGLGRENNGPVVPFRVDVTDDGTDTFQILWPGYAAAGPVRGDVEIAHGCGTGDDDDDSDDNDDDDDDD